MQVGLQREVAAHREVEVERELLEHHADLRQRRAGLVTQVEAADLDASGIGREEPGDQLEERRLAGAVGPQQGHELAGGKGQVQRVEGGAFAIALGEALDLQHEVSGPGIGTCGMGVGASQSSQLERY